MEEQLRQNLILCASAFVERRSLGFATLGRLAAGDWRFFDHLSKDTKTFTARKYDEVMRWFHLNWPPAAVWPDSVSRPQDIATEISKVQR